MSDKPVMIGKDRDRSARPHSSGNIGDRPPPLGPTGITAYREAGGTLERAQVTVAHERPRTTELYDRTSDTVTAGEVERIRI